MRKHSAVIAAATLSLLPLLWLAYFTLTYRCDLSRYGGLWAAGTTPAWLTGWVLGATSAAAFIALLIAPKVWRMGRGGRPLTRGEWFMLGVLPLVLVLLIRIAPVAMIDPQAQIEAFLGKRVDQCAH